MLRAKPFVKWAGGKRQIISDLLKYSPSNFQRYFEPFVGAGALFFELAHRPSILLDYNRELITAYRVIKNNTEQLIDLLREHEQINCEKYYYMVRGLKTQKTQKLGINDRLFSVCSMTETERAARFIYLNRTCYNGLYRINSRGEFNVPYGRHKNPKICSPENLRRVSRVLEKAELLCGDFAIIKEKYVFRSGDFIYFDPPYVPLSETSNFTSYISDGFSKQDQKRLCSLFKYLDSRGARCMLSNSDTDFIKRAYREFNIHRVRAKRTINSAAEKRGAVTELIITNY